MSECEQKLNEENPWQDPTSVSKPRLLPLAVAAILFLLASAAIPLAFYSRVAAVVSVVLALGGGFYLVRRAPRSLLILVGLTVGGFFLLQSFLITGDGYRLVIALTSLLPVICVGITAGAFFQTSVKAYWLFPLLSVAAAGITFAVTRAWLASVCALLLWLPSLLLSVATKKGAYRSSAVCSSAIGLLIGLVGLSLLWVWRASGSCSPEAIQEALGAMRAEVVELGLALRDAYLEEMRAMIAENAHWNEAQVQYANALMDQIALSYSRDALINGVAKCFNLLPAFFFLAGAIPSFLSQAMLNGAYASNGMRAVLTPESEFFTMSVPAAVIYLIATFITLCFASSLNIAVTVADNVCLCFMPGFLVLSARGFSIAFRKMRGFGRGLAVLALILVVSCFSVAALPVMALYGAYLRIFSAAKKRMMNGSGQNGSGPDA